MFNKKIAFALCVIMVGALYFFFDAILIVFPGAITNDLMQKFHITATGISLLAAIYFYIYAPMQFPDGYILDKFGPKKIMILGTMVCIIGLILFATTNNFIIGCIARAIMGLGAS